MDLSSTCGTRGSSVSDFWNNRPYAEFPISPLPPSPLVSHYVNLPRQGIQIPSLIIQPHTPPPPGPTLPYGVLYPPLKCTQRCCYPISPVAPGGPLAIIGPEKNTTIGVNVMTPQPDAILPAAEPKKPLPEDQQQASAFEKARSESPLINVEEIDVSIIYDASNDDSVEKKLENMEKAINQYKNVISIFDKEARRLKRALLKKEADHQRELKLANDQHWQKRGEANNYIRQAQAKNIQLQTRLEVIDAEKKSTIDKLKQFIACLEKL